MHQDSFSVNRYDAIGQCIFMRTANGGKGSKPKTENDVDECSKGKINFGTTIYLQKHSTTYITHKVQCNMLVLNTEMVAKGSKFLYCQALRKHTYSIITFVTLIHLRELVTYKTYEKHMK